MGKKRITQVTKIDPVFRIPEGAEDEFAYSENPIDVADFDTSVFNDDMVDPPQAGVETPTTFRIVNQRIYRGNGNAQAVDVVFETDDIPNAIRYEIKVTKA